jgi:hypothetical protein
MAVGLDKAGKATPREKAKPQNKSQMGANGKANPQGHCQSSPDIAPMKDGVLHIYSRLFSDSWLWRTLWHARQGCTTSHLAFPGEEFSAQK